MIKDPKAAKRILELLEESSSRLTDSIEVARQGCPEEEFKAYLRETAQVLGRIFYLILDPIYREHPGLVPEGGPQKDVERWRAERDSIG
jgi:hypothetical protein